MRKYYRVVKTRAYNAKNNFIISARWSVSIIFNSFIKLLNRSLIPIIYAAISKVCSKFMKAWSFLVAADYFASH